VGESGPDHNKHFVVEVHLNSNVIGKGGGRRGRTASRQRSFGADGLLNTVMYQFLFRTTVVRICAVFAIKIR
jgi:dsRNA-specific ribonuclease